MSAVAPPYGLWLHENHGTQHEYRWQPTMAAFFTDKERTLAIIVSPAALRGAVAMSGWSNNHAANHAVLDNRKMTMEAEGLAREIDFDSGRDISWRPCHVEMQLITFYVTFVRKYADAFKYLQSRQGNESTWSTQTLDICVSREVCDLCHRFAILTYLRKEVEVRFFVDGMPDYPRCERCSTTIIGHRALECWACQAMSIETVQSQLGYRNLTMHDVCKLQQGLRLYILETHPGTFLEQKGYDELRRIEADIAFALKYYSERGRSWILSHRQKRNHAEVVEYLVNIDWKFTKEGPGSDINEADNRETADVQADADPDDEDSELERDEDDSVGSLARRIAGVDLTHPHDRATWYAGPSTDSEEEEMLQENINTNIEKALDGLL